MKPIVSVCIPTYNGDKYLKECLDSVLAQTFTDFEVLIVDDCSSDETVKIAKEYADRDGRIRLIVNEQNLGLVGNWNRCIELAQGEWIKFVFQDDLIEPTCLERMLAASNPNSFLICCRRNFLFEADVQETTRKSYEKFVTYLSLEGLFSGATEISSQDYCEAALDCIGVNFVGEPTSVMLRRRVFSTFGLFNPHLIQICDFEFWMRIASHTGLNYVPETLSTFRVHGESTSAANTKSSRKHRVWMLDGIVLLHDFAFHPAYTSLRTVARERSSVNMDDSHMDKLCISANLVSLLADRAYELRKMAERAAANCVDPDPSLLEDWENLLQFYPLLSIYSERSLSKRIINHSIYRWKKMQRKIDAFLRH